MKVEALTPVIGATVYGIQLADVVHDETLFQTIHELWMQYLVLFFPLHNCQIWLIRVTSGLDS